MKNEKRMDNNGFSLVELIIVIAIMAVLIGVLAPQYMRYVERGRMATDNSNVVAVEGALQVHYTDTEASDQLEDGTTVELNHGPATSSGATAAVNEALRNAGLVPATGTVADLPELTNQDGYDSVTITVSIDENGNVSVTDNRP